MDNETQDSPLETLAKLAEASKAQRLSPADEERAVALLKEPLAGGKAGINSVLELLVALPWIVTVNAVSAAWPEWSVPMRRHLLAGVAKVESEQSLRLRLSLARGIFKIDAPAGLKLAATVAADLKDPETGALSTRHRHTFYNVFIGKGKPWLLQLALADLKGPEADALAHAAIESFSLCPPLSQLSILRWLAGAGRLKKLSGEDVALAAKAVARWTGKLQRQLKAEVPELPEAITAVLKPEPPPAPEAEAQAGPEPAVATEAAEPAPVIEAPELPGIVTEEKPAAPKNAGRNQESRRGERPPRGTREERPPREAREERPPREAREERPPREAREERPPREAREERPPREAREERPPREAREERPLREAREERPPRETREERPQREPRDEKGRKPFDFKETLRSLENYVGTLRNELDQTRTQLRRREDEGRDGRRGGGRQVRGVEEKPSVDVEALQRHNAQLEGTVEELRRQLEEIVAHHEAVAESRLLHSDEPLPEGSADQLKSLLSIRLQESYETYRAMRLDPLDRVFRLDYRDLLGSVFEVLLHEGISLKEKK